MNSIKHSEYRIGIKIDKDPLAVEQNNYLIKILNVYIAYDLDIWLRKRTNNFKFKNCLFGGTNTIKNNGKEKYLCSGYRITSESAGSWSFGSDFSRNVTIFGVDNSSSSHSDNRKNNCLILGEGPTYGINGSSGSPGKRFSIDFTKAIMLIIVICLLKGKKSLNLKPTIKMEMYMIFLSITILLINLTH